jgi:hypothetical protein
MKQFGTFLISIIIAFGFSLSASAQSSGTDLDQVELMKQFAGIWKTESGKDTTFIWEFMPMGKGYELTGNWKAKGVTYSSIKSVYGYAKKMKIVNMVHLYPDGRITKALGEFVSENKLEMEFFNYDHSRTMAKWVAVFPSPDKFEITYTWKGGAETWDDAKVYEYTFIRRK